jgi:hypothetical protein
MNLPIFVVGSDLFDPSCCLAVDGILVPCHGIPFNTFLGNLLPSCSNQPLLHTHSDVDKSQVWGGYCGQFASNPIILGWNVVGERNGRRWHIFPAPGRISGDHGSVIPFCSGKSDSEHGFAPR